MRFEFSPQDLDQSVAHLILYGTVAREYRGNAAPDPSLRLKDGCVQHDALQRHQNHNQSPIRLTRYICAHILCE